MKIAYMIGAIALVVVMSAMAAEKAPVVKVEKTHITKEEQDKNWEMLEKFKAECIKSKGDGEWRGHMGPLDNYCFIKADKKTFALFCQRHPENC